MSLQRRHYPPKQVVDEALLRHHRPDGEARTDLALDGLDLLHKLAADEALDWKRITCKPPVGA